METSNGKLLRPDWNVTFADNSVWHSRTVKWMRQNMKTQFPAAMIDENSDDAILDQLLTVFRNIVQAYNILQKESKGKKNANDLTVPKDDGDLPAENEMPDDAPARRAGRHKSRKTRVCSVLASVYSSLIDTLPEMRRTNNGTAKSWDSTPLSLCVLSSTGDRPGIGAPRHLFKSTRVATYYNVLHYITTSSHKS
jgi:hypothetical protein